MKPSLTLIILCFSLQVIAQKSPRLDSIKMVLEAASDSDQKPRIYLVDTLIKQYGNNSTQVTDYWKYLAAQDSINKKTVISILNTYGWPTPGETSKKASEAIFMVIQHTDIETQIKYLPAVKKAIDEGKIEPAKYAFLSDRIKMNTGYYQTYGTQIGSDYKGNLCFWPIEDELNVNKRRAVLGLDSIQEYAKNFNLVYQAPKVDSLKGNVIIDFSAYGADRHGVPAVNVYALGNKPIGKTNADGEVRVIIPRQMLQLAFVFQKQGFKPATFIEKEKGDVFYVNVVLDKL